MALLTGEQILAADDLLFEDVECPEWGGTVRVRVLSAGGRRAFEQRMPKDRDSDSLDVRTLLVGACLVDEDGKPLFTADQLQALAKKSSVPIVRLNAVCMRINCIGTDEDDAEKK